MSYVSQKKHMQNCLSDLRAFSNNQTAELKALSDQVSQLKEKEKRFELMGGNLQGRLNNLQSDIMNIAVKVNHLAVEMSANKQHALGMALDNIHKMLEAARHKSCTISS